MYCKNCGTQMNENQAVCTKCGTAKGKGKAFCANCGKPVDPNAAVCMSCGVAIKNGGADGELAGQNKLVMILLAIFLGAFGIHNFMMGEVKKGIVKIVASFFCGIGYILSIIDAVRIGMDKYTVDSTKLF